MIRDAGLGCLFCLLVAAPVLAQPSGGPYGPLPQTYAIPKAVHLYYVAPDGKPEASGATLAEPTTLDAAISRVVTGDAIVLRGGIYRTGGLTLNQGITMQPYADERPVLKGTLVADKWEALRNNVWRTRWDRLFPARPLGWWRREREGMITPLHRFNNDMVFVDGELLQSAGWEGAVDAHSFYIDYDSGYVYVGANPANRLVEITAFDCALLRTTRPAHGKTPDKKGFVIRGLTFTQYAYRAIDIEGKRPAASVTEEPTDDPIGPADPSTYGKEVVGTTLEHVTISYYVAGGRLLPRRRPDHPALAGQRYQHRGHLCDRFVRRAAGEEHHPQEQRRAAHGLLPGSCQDLQPVASRDGPRQPGDRSAALQRRVVRRRQLGRRIREQLGRRGSRLLLFRDLQRRDRRRQRVRGLPEGHPRAQQRERRASTTTR